MFACTRSNAGNPNSFQTLEKRFSIAVTIVSGVDSCARAAIVGGLMDDGVIGWLLWRGSRLGSKSSGVGLWGTGKTEVGKLDTSPQKWQTPKKGDE